MESKLDKHEHEDMKAVMENKKKVRGQRIVRVKILEGICRGALTQPPSPPQIKNKSTKT